MTRLVSVLRLELTLQVRQRFLHAAIFSGVMWLALLLPLSGSLRAIAEPYVLQGDILIIGFFFIGGAVFMEKQERTLSALLSTPLRFREYLTAKVAVLVPLSVVVAVFVATVGHGLDYDLPPLLAGVILGTVLMLLAGFTTSLPFASISDWFMPAVVPIAVLNLPLLHYSGVWPNPLLYLIPTQGPLMLLGAAFDQVSLEPWQVAYALAYPAMWVAGLGWLAKVLFDRYVVRKAGGV